MLLKGLDFSYETVLRRELVASELSSKYEETAEVGKGSFGSVNKAGIQGILALRPVSQSGPETRWSARSQRRGSLTRPARLARERLQT